MVPSLYRQPRTYGPRLTECHFSISQSLHAFYCEREDGHVFDSKVYGCSD